MRVKVRIYQYSSAFSRSRFVSANYASRGMWRNSLQRIPPIGFFLVEIRRVGPCRGAGQCRGAARVFRGCVRWSPIRRIWAWRAWCLPGRWPVEAHLKGMGTSVWAMARQSSLIHFLRSVGKEGDQSIHKMGALIILSWWTN